MSDLDLIEAEARAEVGNAMTFSADRLMRLVEVARAAEMVSDSLDHEGLGVAQGIDELRAALARLAQ